MTDHFKVLPKPPEPGRPGRPITNPNQPKLGRPKCNGAAPAVALHPSRKEYAGDVRPAAKKIKHNDWSKGDGLDKMKAAVAGWYMNVEKPEAIRLSMVSLWQTHTRTYIYIYIYICVCVCIDICNLIVK